MFINKIIKIGLYMYHTKNLFYLFILIFYYFIFLLYLKQLKTFHIHLTLLFHVIILVNVLSLDSTPLPCPHPLCAVPSGKCWTIGALMVITLVYTDHAFIIIKFMYFQFYALILWGYKPVAGHRFLLSSFPVLVMIVETDLGCWLLAVCLWLEKYCFS